MSGLLPAAVFGLEVPAGDVAIPAVAEFPAAFRITMAAIDPSAAPEFTGSAIDSEKPRATLKLIREPLGSEDSDDEDEDEERLQALLNGEDDEDEDDESDDDEGLNGGPSDPSKTKKARKEAAARALKEAIQASADKMEMANGVSKGKGKALVNGDDIDMEDDDEDDEDDEIEEFVLCTLDPSQHYQQPLDITVGEDERVYFKVSGTHTIYLTGNYVVPVDDTPRRAMLDDYDEDDYDLEPDTDELDDMGSESDDLDDLDDPRITEVSDEEDIPKLLEAAKGKGKKKRTADDDEPASLDEIMSKSLKVETQPSGDAKLSKKQAKKLKNNAGQPVAKAAETDVKNSKKEDPSPGKKVQFAKELEQGPTGKAEPKLSADLDKKEGKKSAEKKEVDTKKPSTGVRTVQGVKIDDRKSGTGPAAKKGNRVSMRYIGKLNDGKVFDSNKKGKPFSFKLGAGEVIKGWDIGIEGITVGGERRITVPAHLAYGSKSLPGIPSNSQLTFDVKCLEIH